MSAFADIGAVAPQQIWEGVLGRVVHGERVTLGLIELDPDCLVPEHRHDHEQVGILVEGSLHFRIGDERRELRPGDTWRIPSDTPHEAHAGPNGAVVVEVWAPARSDWESLEPQDARPPRWSLR
jgi:quercetin dioxygenase-like cupin family protein